MARTKRISAQLAVQPMVGRVNERGEIVSETPIGPEEVIDTLHFDADLDTRNVTITSERRGTSLTLGYTPAYARGFEEVFGSVAARD